MSLNIGTPYKFIAWDPETSLVFAAGSTYEETYAQVQQLPEEVDTSLLIIEESPPNSRWIIEHNEFGHTVATLITQNIQ